ncbi:MAG TPA: T9SS type A sorting domain-containing protein, partial [Methanosarcina sp.]|nr:T9SS type A sorting domain-containing protein [Methanosarcina sp.]
FSADTYSWATPIGNTIAFTAGDSWYDQFLMKSTDNGTTWTKTKIWSSLYNKWVSTGPNDTTPIFFCPDGSNAIALDNEGKAHIAFGLLRAKGDNAGKYWYPFTDGLVYWNEDMDELPQPLDPDSLFSSGALIGWVDDSSVFNAPVTELAYYYTSMTSQPTITIDESDHIFVMWAGVLDYHDQNQFLLRHIFGRVSLDGGIPFYEDFYELSSNFLYTWSECVYPSASPVSNYEKVFLVFQEDLDAGIYLNGNQGAQGQTSITSNHILFLDPDKTDFIFWSGNNEKMDNKVLVSQNYPNPVQNQCVVNANIKTSGILCLTVTSMTGQELYEINKGYQAPGSHQFPIDATNLKPGLYYYTVRVGNYSVTKKMIVAGE